MLSGTGTSNRPQPREGRRKNKATPIVFNEIAAGDDHQLYIAASHQNVVIGNIINADTAGLGIYITGDNNIVIGNMSKDTIQTAVGGDYNNISANLTDIGVTNLGANNEVGGANKVF